MICQTQFEKNAKTGRWAGFIRGVLRSLTHSAAPFSKGAPEWFGEVGYCRLFVRAKTLP